MNNQTQTDQGRTDRINPLGVIRNPPGPDQVQVKRDGSAFDEAAIEQRQKTIELELAINPMAQAQEILSQCSLNPSKLDTSKLQELLNIQAIRLVKNKDTSNLQELLLAQSLSLNAVYLALVQKALQTRSLKPEHERLYLDLALRFQKQASRTIDLIANLQVPKAATLIQQNMNADNIQVNNLTNELLGT